MLITEDYRKQLKECHNDPNWGTTADRFAPLIEGLFHSYNCKSMLDYGCGKQALRKALPHIKVSGYDPAFPGIDRSPKPRDLVACNDVLEHIEPQFVDNVLDDLQRVVKKVGFFVISTVPAIKKLPDGRNAHLSVHDAEWWLPKLCERFKIIRFERQKGEFAVVVESR